MSGIVTFTSANVANLVDNHLLAWNTASFQENAAMLFTQLLTANDRGKILARQPTQ